MCKIVLCKTVTVGVFCTLLFRLQYCGSMSKPSMCWFYVKDVDGFEMEKKHMSSVRACDRSCDLEGDSPLLQRSAIAKVAM